MEKLYFEIGWFTFSFFLSEPIDCDLGGLNFAALGWIYCDSSSCLFKKYYLRSFLSYVFMVPYQASSSIVPRHFVSDKGCEDYDG